MPVAVGVVTLVAAALRVPGLRESFFGDEMFTYEIATGPTLRAVLSGVRSNMEITPPLFFVLAWLAQKAGDPFVWMRLPAWLAGVATVPLVYRLGLRTVGRRAGLVAAGLFAVSPMAIFYATEARAYSVLTLLVLVSTLTLLRAIETPTWWLWSAFAVLEAAALYTHYTAVFVLFAQAVWALVTRRELWRRMGLAHLAAALLYLPWLPGVLEDRDAPAQQAMARLVPFTRAEVIEALARFVGGGPSAPLRALPGRAGLVLLAIAGVAAMGGTVWRGARRRGHRLDPSAVLVAVLALAAPLGAAAYSAGGHPLFSPRNLMTSLPAVALGFAALASALPRALMIGTVGLTAVALALGTSQSFEPANQRPAYDAVADFVDHEWAPGDVLIELRVFQGPPGLALVVHLDGAVPAFDYAEQAAAFRLAALGHGRVLYVRPESSEPVGLDPALRRGYRITERRSWPGVVPLTVLVFTPGG